jgi:hypothetical protein
MQQGVSFTALELDGDERFQGLRRELGVESFGMNLIRLAPGQRGRIHRHERQEEVYLVLEGPHQLARVAPDVRRRLANLHREPLAVLALGGAHAHEGRDGRAWSAWDEGGPGRPPPEVPLPEDVDVER